jgi:signal transduction histidine kinase
MTDEARRARPAASAGPAGTETANGGRAARSLDGGAAAERTGTAADPLGARGLFRVPLLQKLVVADLVINIAAYVIMRGASQEYADEIMLASLMLTLSLNAVLVYWSLLPLRMLQITADQVASGDLSARVPPSRWADRNIARIGITLNALLDRLLADQARVRYLSAQAIGAADAERAHLARELHDSTAQSLSAVEMLLTATWQETPATGAGAGLRERLGTMREVVTEALHEVRTLSHNVHPSALEHLGLAAALEALARRTIEQSGVRSTVESRVDAPISPRVASVLYRVAQEAMGNALRHACAREVSVRLEVDGDHARLTIRDDGLGFDVRQAESARTGMGLFMMRERLVLVSGDLSIRSEMGRGTTIQAVAPNVQEEGK